MDHVENTHRDTKCAHFTVVFSVGLNITTNSSRVILMLCPPVVLIISPKSPIRVINNKVGNILIPISNKPRQRYNMVRVPVFKPELPGKGKTATLNQVSYYRINRHPGRKPVYFSFFLLSRVFTPHFSIWWTSLGATVALPVSKNQGVIAFIFL